MIAPLHELSWQKAAKKWWKLNIWNVQTFHLLLKAVEITPTECGWCGSLYFVTEAEFLCLIATISHFHKAASALPDQLSLNVLVIALSRTKQTTRRPWGRWRWWRGPPPPGSCSGRPRSSPPSQATSKARFAEREANEKILLRILKIFNIIICILSHNITSKIDNLNLWASLV